MWFSNHLPVENDTPISSTNPPIDHLVEKARPSKLNVHNDLKEEETLDDEKEILPCSSQLHENEVMNMLLHDGCGDVKYSQWNAPFLKKFPPGKIYSGKEGSGHTEDECTTTKDAHLINKEKKVKKSEEFAFKNRESTSPLTAKSRNASEAKKISMSSAFSKFSENSEALPTQNEARRKAVMESRQRNQTNFHPPTNNNLYKNESDASSQSYQKSSRHASPHRTPYSQTCFNCGQIGHQAKHCSKKPHASNGSERKTFAPHHNRKSTMIHAKTAGSKNCHNCGSAEHLAKNCSMSKKPFIEKRQKKNVTE
uniref:CCHC-type domain-containing protein n=1 Tax=Ditylenchus dipsaci TaxID=166011 RepID=A0A915EBB6_9BILA